ncbi:MAG TPA: trypsin-like peptidase domain-containing protein, partial [Planctomycetota bacterium]|nr:trypsin-like peptidase domain-containing protein [Planctomycetota bacterium]
AAATAPGPGAPRAVEPRDEISAYERSVIELYERCSPSVVYISPLREARTSPFSLETQEISVGTGSGFVWDEAGHIVTNYHVVANATGAVVTLNDRSEYRATKLAAFPDKDLAVLTIEAPPEHLVPLALGTSRDLQVGQFVYAIGNPYGFDTTLTHGLISALGRQMDSINGRTIHDVIQTDAAIKPGNSGGPLLDSAGRLVGVTTQIHSPTGTSAGIGFAIPVDDVRRIVEELIATGRVVRPGLGVQIASDREIFQLQHLGVRLEGVPLTGVQPGGAADQAGLRGAPFRRRTDGSILLGDVILRVDDVPTTDQNTLRDALEAHAVGDTVTLTIQRGEERLSVPVTLQSIDG